MPTPLRRFYDNVRTGQIVFRDVGRLRQIVTVLIQHGFGAFVQALELHDRWYSNLLAERRASDDAHLPLERRILHAIQDLGPTFIKLGQMLSTRPDLFPQALIDELQTLQDSVPPLPEEAVRQVVRDELGCEIEEHFAAFDPVPLATASIAQVHVARLGEDGTEVVVKVQRPALQPQIEADLEIMGFLARALETNFPEARMFSPSGMVAEFEKAILKEIDFTNELEHLERFRRNFADVEGVHFPTPYPALCSARVLTMERIVGVKISRITAETHDVDAVVERAIDAVLQMVYVDGFFHGDLHPGNLLVRDDGTLCFIDFGLCGRLSPRQRDLLTDLLIAIVRQDYEGVARQFWNMTIHGRDSTSDFRVFESDVVAHAEQWFAGKTMADIEFSKVLGDLIALSLRHRVRMPPDYTMTFKAIITMEGVGKQLCPDLDILTAAQPYAAKLLAQRYQPRRILETGYAAVRDLADMLGTVPETTRAVLEDLRAGRTIVNIESEQIADWRRTYQHVQHRNTVGLLAGVSALCGTMALDYGGYSILGLPILSTWFYLLALGLGAWYLMIGRRS